MAQPISRHEVERALKEAHARRRVSPLRQAALLAGRRPYADTEAVTRVGADVTVTDIVSKPILPFDEETTDRMLGERCVVGRDLAYAGVPERFFGLLLDDGGKRRGVVVERLPAGVLGAKTSLAAFSPDAWLGTHLCHLNLIPLLKVHESDSGTLVASRYLLGETLARLRSDGNRLPLAVTVAIVAGILDALHAAHGAADSNDGPLEIVHGNLAPARILIGIDGVARTLGFGWSRKAAPRHQPPAGIPGYAAPEQVFDQHVDAQTDIFSIGVVLWECLTGCSLIEGASAVDGMLQFLASGARPPSRVNPNVPSELDGVVLRALEPTPERRFRSAAEFASELLSCAEPASAPEVAHYVQGVAWSALERRRTILATLESGRVSLVSAVPRSRLEPASAPPAVVISAMVPASPAMEEEEPTHLRGEPLFEEPTHLRLEPVFEEPTHLRLEPLFEEPTHLRLEPVLEELTPEREEVTPEREEITPERAPSTPDRELPPVSYWSARDAQEATAVEGRPRPPLPAPELLDAVIDGEPTDAEAVLRMQWIQRPPLSIEPIATSESIPLTRTEAPLRVQRERSVRRVIVLTVSLCLVFFGAFAAGSFLREHRSPLGFVAPRSESAPLPTPQPELAKARAPVALAPATPRTSTQPPARSSGASVPVMRLEDLPVARPTEAAVDAAQEEDKSKTRRNARRRGRGRP